MDNSKYIDFKEFIIALSITSRGTEEQKINWSFKMYDYKKEGKIGYKEILPIVKATYKMVGPMVELPEDQQTPEARVDRYFQLLGKDKNTDKLDLNDFKNWFN